jgi:hypothetical protein
LLDACYLTIVLIVGTIMSVYYIFALHSVISVPDQPESVVFRNVSSTSVTFYWEEPCKPNGIITGYIISYNITTRTANVHCPVEISKPSLFIIY